MYLPMEIGRKNVQRISTCGECWNSLQTRIKFRNILKKVFQLKS